MAYKTDDKNQTKMPVITDDRNPKKEDMEKGQTNNDDSRTSTYDYRADPKLTSGVNDLRRLLLFSLSTGLLLLIIVFVGGAIFSTWIKDIHDHVSHDNEDNSIHHYPEGPSSSPMVTREQADILQARWINNDADQIVSTLLPDSTNTEDEDVAYSWTHILNLNRDTIVNA